LDISHRNFQAIDLLGVLGSGLAKLQWLRIIPNATTTASMKTSTVSVFFARP